MNKKEDERKKRAIVLIEKLKKLYPHAGIMLQHKTTWELLVAVQLSAQCTDKRVNEITKTLFKKYPTFQSYLSAHPKEFEKDIFSAGFYKNKTKNILAAAKKIQTQFNGKVPRTMEELCSLPGVARKTANIVLGQAFNIVEGIAVDTHVRRFAIKFDLTDSKNTSVIEKDLMRYIPKKYWFKSTYWIIEYGRNICPAHKHDCTNHPLSKIYPPAAHTWPKAH